MMSGDIFRCNSHAVIIERAPKSDFYSLVEDFAKLMRDSQRVASTTYGATDIPHVLPATISAVLR
jgi:hypothetical protein